MDKEEPRGYLQWLLIVARVPLPLRSDWRGVGKHVLVAAKAVASALLLTAVRLAILLTLPISAPLLAVVLNKLNKRWVEKTIKRRAEVLAGYTNHARKPKEPA